MKISQPLIEFNPKLPKLSKNERAVLKLLIEAGKLIAPLYLEQENQIQKATPSHPDFHSPYTVVEKVNGKLVATPYHIKYAMFLKPITDKLEQAANLCGNKEFAKALRVQAKALLEGSYKQATITWLGIKPYILDISIGPVEHLDDKLFAGKASYEAWVGVLDEEGTQWLNSYKDVTLSTRRKALVPKERVDEPKVKTKLIEVILLSGLMARTKFTGVNLPYDASLVEKYGSEITLFNQPNDLRVKEQIYPAFNKTFSKGFKQGFTFEDLRWGYLRGVALHELAHSYLYYRHAAKNLQDLFQCIYELSATVLGFRMAGSLLLKDRITDKQLESLLIAYICRSFYLIDHQKSNKSMANYTLGGAIFINFMLESGALKQFKGMVISNFMKIFISLHDLSYILERLLSSGTRKDAENFIKKYGGFNNLS